MTPNHQGRETTDFRAATLLQETMEGLRATQCQLLAQDPDAVATHAPLLARIAAAMTQAARVHDQITRTDEREKRR